MHGKPGPENHDTDFNWPDFVEKINSELNAAYGNFVHRILTLGARLPQGEFGPYAVLERKDVNSNHISKLSTIFFDNEEGIPLSNAI